MKKTIALLLTVCMLALLLAGCQVNREKDMAQVVLSVGETEYTKQQVYDMIAAQLQASGYAIDLMDEDMDEETRAALDDLAVSYVEYLMNLEVASVIVDRDMPLSEAEIKEIDDSVDEYVEFVKMYMLSGEEGTADPESGETKDMDALVDEYFMTNVGMSVEQYRQQCYKEAKLTKLDESLTKDATADEAAVKAKYEADLEAQKEAAITGENYYESLTAGDGDSMGAYTLFKPDGYRIVKHILIAFTDDEADQLDALSEKLSAAEKIVSDAESAKSKAEEAKAEAETAGNTEEAANQQKIIDMQNAIIKEKTPEKDALQKQYFNLRDSLAAGHMKKAEQIAARLKKGEDFDVLLKEFGEDPGMKSGAASITGYLLSPSGYGYDETFVDAAEKLTKSGEIGEPVVTDFGVHIIKLVYGTDEAELPYDLVKDVVQPYADAEAKDAVYKAGMEKYAAELGAKSYPDRVKFVK